MARQKRRHTGSGSGLHKPGEFHPAGAKTPGSEVPPSAPPPSIEAVVPPRVAGAGGLENIPEEFLPEDKRAEDLLNHAGLDTALPGEDRAPAEAAEEHSDQPASPPEEMESER